MKITIVYIFPNQTCHLYRPYHFLYGCRFVETYLRYPPTLPHSILVVSNGGDPCTEMRVAFETIPVDCEFITHDDQGWDIGGFQKAARERSADVMLFLGGPTYFHRLGWLERLHEVWTQNPNQICGCFGSHQIRPHLRTTGLYCDPKFILMYPKLVATPQDRYEFEHGPGNFGDYCQDRGAVLTLVTYGGTYHRGQWRNSGNGFWQGDQSECLIRDNHTDAFQTADQTQRTNLRYIAGG